MTIYETDQPSNTGDVALYFPSKTVNYYLKPIDEKCIVVSENILPETDDHQLSRKHLYFTRKYENPGNQ